MKLIKICLEDIWNASTANTERITVQHSMAEKQTAIDFEQLLEMIANSNKHEK